MKLFILAAGMGTRLLPLTRNTPKVLIDLGNGNTLLESQLESAEESGVIEEVVIVTGYLAEQIDAKLVSRVNGGKRIRTVYNPFYASTNNFVSLWLLLNEMKDDDFMITNGDNLIAPSVFRKFARENTNDGVYLSVVLPEMYSPDDMKVVYSDSVLKWVSKQVPVEQANGESPGLALVRGEPFRKLVQLQMGGMARDQQFLDGYWLELFNRLTAVGINVRVWEFACNLWREVDIHIDVDQAKQLVIDKVKGFMAADGATESVGQVGGVSSGR